LQGRYGGTAFPPVQKFFQKNSKKVRLFCTLKSLYSRSFYNALIFLKGVIFMIAGNELVFGENDEIKIEQIKPDMDVNKLIIQCRTDKKSLEILYDTFRKDVFALAFSILGDYHLSEDCVTETFVRLTQVKRFSKSGGNGKGFILKITRNCAMEIHRRYKREACSEVIQAYGEAEKTVEDSIYINQLLKNISDKQRQVIIMRCCNQLSFKEIAKIMHSPESTVKSRYKRAMDILRKKVGEKNEIF